MNPLHRRALLCLLVLTASAPRASNAQELTLRQALESAIEAHPALRVAQARVESANHTADASRASLLPAFAVTGSMTRFDEPMIVAPLHAFDPTNPPIFEETLVQGQAGLGYTLFDAGARTSRVSGADARVEAEEYGSADTRMATMEDVTRAYLGVLTARSVSQAAQAQVAAMESEVDRARQHLEAGTAADVEVLRAGAALQDARAASLVAVSRVGLAERTLARLMGTSAESLAGVPLADVQLSSAGFASAPSGSPLLGQASRLVAMAESRLDEERAARLPRLELKAGLVDFGSLSTDHVVEWQAGLQVSWPIFSGGARRSSVRRAQADVRVAESQSAVTELRVSQMIDVARTAIADADARSEALSASVAQWTEVARIETLAVAAGSGVQSDLLRAQAALFQARSGQISARYESLLARVSLARAEGALTTESLTRALEARQ